VSVEELRALARVHEIVAWIATAALAVAPWIIFRESARRGLVIAASAVAVLSITLAGALGLLLDDAYRSQIRQRLFVEAPMLGWLFERKEHLAFGAILLGWSGLLSLGAALLLAARPSRRTEDELSVALTSELRLAAKVGWAAAAILALAACVASTIVARQASF
jgi:hypothetical protein